MLSDKVDELFKKYDVQSMHNNNFKSELLSVITNEIVNFIRTKEIHISLSELRTDNGNRITRKEYGKKLLNKLSNNIKKGL